MLDKGQIVEIPATAAFYESSKISGIKNNSEVHIYSLTGQVVQTVKNVSDKDRILLKKLPKGVYIIKTQDQATKIIVK